MKPLAGARVRPLDAGWRLALTAPDACAGPSEAAALDGWIEAPVPGTAAQALEAAGRWRREAPAPLHDKDVWYRLSLPESGARRLRFDGLATVAEAWIDERPLLTSASMFQPSEAEVEIAPGAELWICFRALAPRLASAKGPRARWRPQMMDTQGLRLVRTTALGHMPGWCPSIDIVGPWRPILLIEHGPLRVEDVRLQPSWAADGGRLAVRLRLTGVSTPPVLHCAGARAALTSDGEGAWTGVLHAPAAAPWFPHTHGEPRLYPVHLEVGGETIDLGRTGFRSLSVDRGADGTEFRLRINGEPVFCRGACWITPDLAGLAGDRAAYEPTLRQARAAGMNMIRVAGVGVYETPAFFEVCDELGLLVWQDFMFANFDYPGADPAFAEAARAEADAFLAAVGAAPSLAVLCGGSEVMQQAAMLGLAPGALAWPLFDEVLASVAADRRPDAPYVPNSPSGGALPFVADAGVTHYYGVGAYERPLEDVRRADVRFAAECLAFANVPGAATLARALPVPPVHDPRWKARVPRDRGASWDFEDTREHYFERLFGLDPRRVRREDPDLYLDLSRAVTGEVMAQVLAEWRRAGSRCGGGLVWTLRDLEVGAGWGLIDALGAAKPALRILRRVLQPQQVLLTDEGVNGLAVHLINESGAPLEGEVRLAVFGEAPGAVLDVRRPLRLAARESRALSAFELVGRFFDLSYAYRFGPRPHEAVIAQLIDGEGAVMSEAAYLPPGVQGWAAAPIEAELSGEGGAWSLRLTAARLQRFVQIDDPAFEPSDDWFVLAPGEPRTLALTRRPDASPDARPAGEIRAAGGRICASYAAD